MSNVEQTSITQQVVSNLRMLRSQRGWSAQTLSEKLLDLGVDMSRSTITNIENARREDFSLSQAIGIAKVFDVSIEWLITLHGPMCNHCKDEPPFGYVCVTCNQEGF